jgi:hypothetical protein
VAGNLRFRSNNQMRRFYDVEADLKAAGFRFKPDAESVLVRMDHYASMQSQTLTNQRLAQDLVETPGVLAAMSGDVMPGYTAMDNATLAKMASEKSLLAGGKSAKQAKMLAGHEGQVLVKDEWLPYVKAVFGGNPTSDLGHRYDQVAQSIKAAKLIGTFFHPMTLVFSATAQTVRHPITMTIVTAKTVPRWARAMLFGAKKAGKGGLWNKFAVAPRSITHPVEAADALFDGINAAAPVTVQRHVADEAIRSLEEFFGNQTLGRVGIAARPKPLSWAKRRFDYALWDVLFSDYKLMLHHAMKAQSMKYASKYGITAHDVGRAVAEQLNYAFGSHLWEALPGILKDPTFRKVARRVTFAPDWYVSNWGNFTRPITTLIPRAGETASLAGMRKVQGHLARQYAMGGVALFALANALNRANTKRDFGVAYNTWDTPGNDVSQVKNIWSVYIGKMFNPHTGQFEEKYSNVGKMLAEPLGAMDLEDPVGGVGGYFMGKIHPFISGPVNALTGQNWKLKQKMLRASGAGDRSLAYMEYLVEAYGSPFWWTAAREQGSQSALGLGVFRLHKGTYYARLEKQYNALVNREAEAVRTGDQQDIIRVYHDLDILHARAMHNGIKGDALLKKVRSMSKHRQALDRRNNVGYMNR